MPPGYRGSTHHLPWLAVVEQRLFGEVEQDYSIVAGAGNLEAGNPGAEGTVLHLGNIELGLAVGIATLCEMR